MTDSRRQAREWSIRYLYQCELEQISFFSAQAFEDFLTHFLVPKESHQMARELVKGTLDHMSSLDEIIASRSKNWNIKRMNLIDKIILRLAAYEIKFQNAPRKVVINEAVDMAKTFGTEKSGPFVNGVLDGV